MVGCPQYFRITIAGACSSSINYHPTLAGWIDFYPRYGQHFLSKNLNFRLCCESDKSLEKSGPAQPSFAANFVVNVVSVNFYGVLHVNSWRIMITKVFRK